MKCFYPVIYRGVLSPCGQCQACLINKQQQWKFRLHKEVLVSDLAFWLTLQYDEEHLPRSNGVPCVNKLHCQDFFRQMRKYLNRHKLPIVFKYFLVSEYGPATNRPHYHCLMLFTFYEEVSPGYKLEVRKKLYNVIYERWYHGHVTEKPFHAGVVRYLTKYVFKPSSSFSPPVANFRLISKGIGERYLEKVNINQVIRDRWRTPDGILPRYYRDKIFPLTPNTWDSNRWTRLDIYNRTADIVERDQLRELHKCGSVEEYYKKLDYMTSSQKSLVEQKQKRKFNG